MNIKVRKDDKEYVVLSGDNPNFLEEIGRFKRITGRGVWPHYEPAPYTSRKSGGFRFINPRDALGEILVRYFERGYPFGRLEIDAPSRPDIETPEYENRLRVVK